ncbi:glycoside hydrolase family 18 protein [Coniochaeta sp. 2T2.1]|nr:glycoside hydrolase family 18 protein [Coniochaeta sp. 2T2.1]
MPSSLSKLVLTGLSLYLGLTGATSTHQQPEKRGSNTSSGYVNGVYFGSWVVYDRQFNPSRLPVDHLTHVFYGFVNLDAQGNVHTDDSWADVEKILDNGSQAGDATYAAGCVGQLNTLKKAHPHVKVLLSIGGWTYSQNDNFPTAANTTTGRATFAKSAVSLMNDYGFDGIDIDWEYPKNETQGKDFLELLRTVRVALDEYAKANAPGHHFLLTIAASAGADHYNLLPLAAIAEQIDFFNLMAYDYSGDRFSTLTAHQANLFPNPNIPGSTAFSIDAAVQAYIAKGVPPNKIILGMPIYGRAFTDTDGLGKPFRGASLANQTAGSWEAGVYDYKALPREGAVEEWDDVAKASYSYDARARELISYDTVRSVRNKVDYLKDKGLGGGFFWEASADSPGDKSLIKASCDALGGQGSLDQGGNWLDYPNSRFTNIRANGAV